VKLNVCAVDLQALLKVSSKQNISAVLRVLRITAKCPDCCKGRHFSPWLFSVTATTYLNVQTVVKEDILVPGLFQ